MGKFADGQLKHWNQGRSGRLFQKGWKNPKPSKPPLTGPVDPGRPAVPGTPPAPGERPPVAGHERPYPGLENDPLLKWGKSLEDFQAQQVRGGFDLIREKRPIDTLADHAQVDAAKATLDWNPGPLASGSDPLPGRPLQAEPMAPQPLLDPLAAVVPEDPMAPAPLPDPMAPKPGG